jgi:hypothetical protein
VLGGAHFWYFFHTLGRLKYNDDDVSMWGEESMAVYIRRGS